MAKTTYHLPDWALNFTQRIKPKMAFRSVSGAAADTNIAVAGIVQATDVVLLAYNVTDDCQVKTADVKAFGGGAEAVGNGKYDAVLEAKPVGSSQNGWKVTLVGDHETGEDIDVDLFNRVMTIHYLPATSTVATVNTAIAALADADDVIDVKAAGTEATVLDAGAAGSFFLGGAVDAVDELPIISANGQIQFPNAVTTGKTLVIGFFNY